MFRFAWAVRPGRKAALGGIADHAAFDEMEEQARLTPVLRELRLRRRVVALCFTAVGCAMSDRSKLSPGEFLAELKGHAAAESTLSGGVLETLDTLALDLSELDELPAENAADVDEAGSERPSKPRAALGNARLSHLFDRVNDLLGGRKAEADVFVPRAPESLEQTGMTFEEVERLILKYLLSKGSSTGRLTYHQYPATMMIGATEGATYCGSFLSRPSWWAMPRIQQEPKVVKSA